MEYEKRLDIALTNNYSAKSVAIPRRLRFDANAANRIDRRSASPLVSFQHVRGSRTLIAARPALADLAKKTGQQDSVEDLNYFLEKPGLMKRIPHLVLMNGSTLTGSADTSPQAALLIHEFRPLGVPSGVFATTDRSGRGGLIGERQDRLRFALRAADYLFRRSAKMVLMTVQCEADPAIAGWGRCRSGVQWAYRNRLQPSFLQLGSTYEETLASLGQKTRANLRYYRLRAESELKCRFLSAAEITPEDLFTLSRESCFPLPQRILRWRLQVQQDLKMPYLMGLKDGNGHWLSIIAGRRFGQSTEILWQLNRTGLQKQSIVTAMRSFHMEYEISQGMNRFYVEGGTNHSMQNAFQTEQVTDIVMIRSTLRAGMSGFARRYVPPDNILADMLNDPKTDWRSS